MLRNVCIICVNICNSLYTCELMFCCKSVCDRLVYVCFGINVHVDVGVMCCTYMSYIARPVKTLTSTLVLKTKCRIEKMRIKQSWF